MDENRQSRRRELTPGEKKNLSRQQLKERELRRKQMRREARIREQARAEARRNGGDAHIVIEIPSAPEKKPGRPRRKTLPEIIEKETDRKVRDMEPTDHRDGYYVNEVGVRKKTAEKQRKRRKKAQPKPISPKQRRVRRIIAYISIIVSVIIIGVVLSLTVLFKAEYVEVEGNKYYDDSRIILLSGVNEGDNIFVASMFANTDKIVNTLPYIKSADVGFSIPNGLVITVKNQSPYYSLRSGGAYYLVSKDNRLLEKVDKKPKKLMYIEAPELKSTEIGDYVEFKKESYTNALDEITASLKRNKYENVTAISVKDINSVKITYDNRIVIKIGLPDAIDYKIRTAFTIINNNLDPNKAGTIMGILNVSNCNTGSKKSYFEEVEIKETESKKKKSSKSAESTTAPDEATTAPDEATTAPDGETASTEAVTEETYYEEYPVETTEEVTYYDDLYGYYNQAQSEMYYGSGTAESENYYYE